MVDDRDRPAPDAVRPENSFAVLPDLRSRFPRPGTRWIWLWRLWFGVRRWWRRFRVLQPVTRVLGPQYRRSRDLIEIDITYFCNLHCFNCNRSVTQAPEALHMSVDTIARFVDESLASQHRWRRIRVLGGEPTLHPDFLRIVDELLRYRSASPTTIVEVVTNGYGDRVKSMLRRLPPEILIDNSRKEGPEQPTFGPFNLAPADDPAFGWVAYANACEVVEGCGMGLTPQGYYPCAVAGGIDRILGENHGRRSLPDRSDDMLAESERLCRLCGRFRDGHFVPKALREPLRGSPVSPTWERLYREWKERRLSEELRARRES